MNLPTVLIGFSALFAIIGSVTPWAVIRAPFFGELSNRGTDGEGVYTLVLAFIAVAALLISYYTKHAAAAGAVALIVLMIAILGIVDAYMLDGVVNDPALEGLASVGFGLYLVIIGGIGAAVGGVWLVIDHMD